MTVGIKRWYILLHPEIATASEGLSLAAVVAMKATEQQAEVLRVGAGCVHERVAAAASGSRRTESDVPPMTPMTGVSFNGGALGTLTPAFRSTSSFLYL